MCLLCHAVLITFVRISPNNPALTLPDMVNSFLISISSFTSSLIGDNFRPAGFMQLILVNKEAQYKVRHLPKTLEDYFAFVSFFYNTVTQWFMWTAYIRALCFNVAVLKTVYTYKEAFLFFTFCFLQI